MEEKMSINYSNYMTYKMVKEISLIGDTPNFIFIGIDPHEYLDKVLNIFESNFKFTSKKYISGWHSTVLEYIMQDLTITIGNESDVLSLTLVNPITENSIEKTRAIVKIIDKELTQ